MTEIHRDCPAGYRFLVQLVDAASHLEARREIEGMYGRPVAMRAVILSGACEALLGPSRWTFQPLDVKRGFRVYIPLDVRL